MKFTDKTLTISQRLELVNKMTFSQREIDLIDERHDGLIGRHEHDLKPIELHYLVNEDNELNTCNKCGIIKNTWDTDEFKWDCDHDLKGHTALCDDCYEELNCKPYEI